MSNKFVVNSKRSTNYQLPAKRTNNQLGQTLLELVVVISVVVIVMGALTFATIASIRNASFAQNQLQATKLSQEGIERVRVGRDRNKDIIQNGALGSVSSWNGNSESSGAFWDYQVDGNCADSKITPPRYCYFKVAQDGVLNYLIGSTSFPSAAESIPPFQRVVVISDEGATYNTQKTVTVIVRWADFSGTHESRLTTILRRI